MKKLLTLCALLALSLTAQASYAQSCEGPTMHQKMQADKDTMNHQAMHRKMHGMMHKNMQGMHRNMPKEGPMQASSDTVRASMVDGVQVLNLTVTHKGYSPSAVELQAGIPARLVFTRTADGGCMDQVQIPALGIGKTKLPLNEPVAIEFTPENAGMYTFQCGMGMMEGSIMVES